MTNTNEFFKEKKSWSVFKDGILDFYLTPYLRKIVSTKKPVTIIDCFAGKGKFDDGDFGSPLIILNRIGDIKREVRSAAIKLICIEKKYFEDLSVNLSGHAEVSIVGGSFEEKINPTLSAVPQSNNLFLYIDPYGVKSLDFNIFKILKERKYNSLEVLINLNTFGFLREGCRLIKCDPQFEDENIDLDYETDATDDATTWNRIAGGAYWKDIVSEKKNEKISMYEAEELFTTRYIDKLKTIFKYVISIPIKTQTKNVPKYRMIFCTNHLDGFMIMADNMHKKWIEMNNAPKDNQLLLFYFTPRVKVDIDKFINASIPKNTKVLFKDVLISVVDNFGIIKSVAEYTDCIKTIIKAQGISAEWVPPRTPTGRIPSSYNYKEYDIFLTRKS